ncbi:hypothetical protein PC116_g19939 [Phytophthora cactorum]|nr:hypothetical protein C6341_g18220 [Phytophthora cactorum]KAG3168690.1 hypothetical protein PC128_g19346 [Phytophthora cactorum]KAG4048118.1 hypothetical protein PC123_g16542 [Phytophthora cactorum]KAG4231814.1 hypothetical protein PC116_g19939 [Phytophthora cactorum]
MIRRTATRSLESRRRGERNHAIENVGSVGVVVDHGGRKVVELRSSVESPFTNRIPRIFSQNLAFATRSPRGVSCYSLSRHSSSARVTKSSLHV